MGTIAIAGGHGKIALLLGALLTGRDDTVRGLIRNPDQADDLRAIGVEPVVCDLEGDGDVVAAVRGADAVVFAAGAGPGSGAARKSTMDLGGAVKLIEAAAAAGISRYLMVSAMGAAEPPAEGADAAAGDDVFGAYLRAKAAADEALRASGLDYTIVRPGGLTDEPGTGLVAIGERLERGQIPRADVAAVLLACLDDTAAIGKSFDLIGGETPIAEALAALPR
ncbi:MAG: SDR family oxidoreductase [Solirubrobacterales bacterium]